MLPLCFQAHRDLVQQLTPIIGPGDLIKSRSQLRFTVKSHSFRNGMLVIRYFLTFHSKFYPKFFFSRCKATILNLYQRFSERRIQEASMIDPEVVVVFSDLENRSNSRGEYFLVLKNYSWKDEKERNKRFPRKGVDKGSRGEGDDVQLSSAGQTI